MAYLRSYFFKIIVLLSSFSLLVLPVTDADLVDVVRLSGNTWKSSTLAIKDTSTVNGGEIENLFNISDLQSPGLAVASFRLRNTGESDVRYSLKYVTNDNSALCQSLRIKLLNDNKIQYEGSLVELKLDFSAAKDIYKDWVAMIDFNSLDQNLTNQTCNFAFDIQARAGDLSVKTGFHDKQLLLSRIATSTWN